MAVSFGLSIIPKARGASSFAYRFVRELGIALRNRHDASSNADIQM